MRQALLVFIILGSINPTAAAPSTILSARQAYAYKVTALADRIEVLWTIRPGYYLYRSRILFECASTEVKLGNPALPRGETHEDEFIGAQEVYRSKVLIAIPYTVAGTRPNSVILKLKWQGCADAGLCYPPTTWETEVRLPAGSPP